jgi:hypothetical protein
MMVEEQNNISNIAAPDQFVCPLTMEIMTVPLRNKVTGKSFEREAINSWMFLQGKSTCPLTREPICPSDFVQDRALQMRIQQWKEENQISAQDENDEDDDDDEDDELFLEVLENANKIQALTSQARRVNETGKSHESLAALGAKVLQQRDERIKQSFAQQSLS